MDVRDEWPMIRELLPEGWEQKARELGAVRRLRGVSSVEKLLRMLLMHLADGCSLKQTSARMSQLGWGQTSAVSILKRLRSAGQWLGWMANSMRRQPQRPATCRCIAVDATTVMEPGPSGSQWRVHWSVDLTTLNCEYFELTDVHGGEKFARFPIVRGQLVLADRGYSNPGGIDYVLGRQADVLIRLNAASLPLYGRKEGKPIHVLGKLRGMKVGQVRAWPAWVKGPEGRWHRGRMVAVKRSLAATKRTLRLQRDKARRRGRKPGKQAQALARYVVLWTSVPKSQMTARQVLWHYRLRWQQELVFKRIKSIMGMGQLPKYSDASSRAWLNGKLLVAMMVEKLWRQAEHFSPWGYRIEAFAKPLA